MNGFVIFLSVFIRGVVLDDDLKYDYFGVNNMKIPEGVDYVTKLNHAGENRVVEDESEPAQAHSLHIFKIAIIVFFSIASTVAFYHILKCWCKKDEPGSATSRPQPRRNSTCVSNSTTIIPILGGDTERRPYTNTIQDYGFVDNSRNNEVKVQPDLPPSYEDVAPTAPPLYEETIRA